MRRKGNFESNYPQIIKFLGVNPDYEFTEYNKGQHIKITSSSTFMELWPSRMTYHIIWAKWPTDGKYHSMSPHFKPAELKKVLDRDT